MIKRTKGKHQPEIEEIKKRRGKGGRKKGIKKIPILLTPSPPPEGRAGYGEGGGDGVHIHERVGSIKI